MKEVRRWLWYVDPCGGRPPNPPVCKANPILLHVQQHINLWSLKR